jgi:hypothetical protein
LHGNETARVLEDAFEFFCLWKRFVCRWRPLLDPEQVDQWQELGDCFSDAGFGKHGELRVAWSIRFELAEWLFAAISPCGTEDLQRGR